MAKQFHIKPLPFQTGEKVKTPRGEGVITAIGTDGANIAYRVGRGAYWYGFQLSRRLKRPAHVVKETN